MMKQQVLRLKSEIKIQSLTLQRFVALRKISSSKGKKTSQPPARIVLHHSMILVVAAEFKLTGHAPELFAQIRRKLHLRDDEAAQLRIETTDMRCPIPNGLLRPTANRCRRRHAQLIRIGS
jgi:hypothetical protein